VYLESGPGDFAVITSLAGSSNGSKVQLDIGW